MVVATSQLIAQVIESEHPVDPRRAAGFVFDIVCCDCEVVYAYMKGPGAGGETHGYCPVCYEARRLEFLGPEG